MLVHFVALHKSYTDTWYLCLSLQYGICLFVLCMSYCNTIFLCMDLLSQLIFVCRKELYILMDIRLPLLLVSNFNLYTSVFGCFLFLVLQLAQILQEIGNLWSYIELLWYHLYIFIVFVYVISSSSFVIHKCMTALACSCLLTWFAFPYLEHLLPYTRHLGSCEFPQYLHFTRVSHLFYFCSARCAALCSCFLTVLNSNCFCCLYEGPFVLSTLLPILPIVTLAHW